MRSSKSPRCLRKAPNSSSPNVIADVNCSSAATVDRRRATPRSGRGRSTAEIVSVSNRYAMGYSVELRWRPIHCRVARGEDLGNVRIQRLPVSERSQERQQPTGTPRKRQVGMLRPDRPESSHGTAVAQNDRPLPVLSGLEQAAELALDHRHWQNLI